MIQRKNWNICSYQTSDFFEKQILNVRKKDKILVIMLMALVMTLVVLIVIKTLVVMLCILNVNVHYVAVEMRYDSSLLNDNFSKTR